MYDAWSAAGTGADHEVVERVFCDLEPEIFLVPEGAHAVVDLLEVGVLGRDLVHEFVRGLEGGFHRVLAEWAKLRAGPEEPAERRGIAGVIFGLHVSVRITGGGLDDGLVMLRQLVPLAEIEEEVGHGAAYPEARVVVE